LYAPDTYPGTIRGIGATPLANTSLSILTTDFNPAPLTSQNMQGCQSSSTPLNNPTEASIPVPRSKRLRPALNTPVADFDEVYDTQLWDR
jgi:hypothetical protein